MTQNTETQNISNKLEKYKSNHDPKLKNTMSVPEMRKLLGLKKTASYWLVHKNYFETKLIDGKMRVDLESFEKWYANQVKHKKVNGEVPGQELMKTSYSFMDVANLLGIRDSSVYAVWKEENLETIIVEHVRRIPIAVFESWYENQIMYQKADRMPTLMDMEADYILLQDAAELLGITREKLSAITRMSRFKTDFEIRIFQNKKWISKKSFQQFLNAQSVYQVIKEPEKKMSVGKFEAPKCILLKELLAEYIKIYGHDKWSVSTYDGNVGVINNYIIPTIGDTKISAINNHFLENYYKELLTMPAMRGNGDKKGEGKISAATVNEIHKILRSCFRQAVKWGLMEKNPAIDATVPKHKKQKREIWTAEMLLQAINACENRCMKVAFHLAFTATLRMGELLGLTWDCVDISEEAISENRAYIIVNKEVERVSKQAVDDLNSKDIILEFPSIKKNNKTVRVLKTPKTESSIRRVYIPKSVALCLIDLKKEQDEIIEVLGSEYHNYNLVMATTFGLPIGDSYLRNEMQKIIDAEGLPDVVFHSIRHTSVTYKLKLSGGDIKAVQGDSGHAQADMVTEVYGHIIDEDRRKNAELMESAFYNKENLTPEMRNQKSDSKQLTVPEGVDAELLMKVLGNPEMAALLTSLAKTIKV